MPARETNLKCEVKFYAAMLCLALSGLFSAGCKHGNIEQGDLPLAPVWHQEQK
jgi:hypothetical protein